MANKLYKPLDIIGEKTIDYISWANVLIITIFPRRCTTAHPTVVSRVLRSCYMYSSMQHGYPLTAWTGFCNTSYNNDMVLFKIRRKKRTILYFDHWYLLTLNSLVCLFCLCMNASFRSALSLKSMSVFIILVTFSANIETWQSLAPFFK
jgi:hypothetical protein